MKVYFPLEVISPNSSEILATLKNFFEKQTQGLTKDPLFSLSYDREDQFFLKSGEGMVWGKLFSEPFTLEKAQKLKQEHKILAVSLQCHVELNVFFAQGELNPDRSQEYPFAHYFQYSFIESSGEKAMLIQRISFLKDYTLSKQAGNTEVPTQNDYSFSKQSQMTRNELAELIDLSLDLKRL